MNVIKMENIKREYIMGKSKDSDGVIVRALRGLDFSAQAGEFISIMGPSGSGKSTLMNILGCLDKPTEGAYYLDGIETSTSSSNTFAYIRNRKIGFVFQSFNLLARTSALENVELPVSYCRKARGEKRISNHTRKNMAAKALKEVGLENRMDHFPSQLSGGQQQRVAIARAMVNDPAFILADEPTGNLDTGMMMEIMGLFQKLNERGKTIIIVTHEPEVASYTKRTITLRDGEMVSDTLNEKQRDALLDLSEWKSRHEVYMEAAS